MIPRYGRPPLRGMRYRRRPGVYVILPRGRDLLLTCQKEPGPEIQLPGGGVDPGESPLPALHREVFEETGWSIAAPRRFAAFRRFVFMPEYDLWAEKLCTIYLAAPVRQLSEPTEPDHVALWMPARDAARRLGNSGDRAVLAHWLSHRRHR